MKVELAAPVRIKRDTFDKYMDGLQFIINSLNGRPVKHLLTIKRMLKTRQMQPHLVKFMINAGIITLSQGHYVLGDDCQNPERHKQAIRLHFDYIYNKRVKYIKL